METVFEQPIYQNRIFEKVIFSKSCSPILPRSCQKDTHTLHYTRSWSAYTRPRTVGTLGRSSIKSCVKICCVIETCQRNGPRSFIIGWLAGGCTGLRKKKREKGPSAQFSNRTSKPGHPFFGRVMCSLIQLAFNARTFVCRRGINYTVIYFIWLKKKLVTTGVRMGNATWLVVEGVVSITRHVVNGLNQWHLYGAIQMQYIT